MSGPYLIANLFVNFKNVLPGMTLGVDVFDLLNERPAVLQAYNGDYAPIPGRSREFVLKLFYQLDFTK